MRDQASFSLFMHGWAVIVWRIGLCLMCIPRQAHGARLAAMSGLKGARRFFKQTLNRCSVLTAFKIEGKT